MTSAEFEAYLAALGHTLESADGGEYMIIRNVPITSGTHAGKTCDVGIQRSPAVPWVPQSAVHVRPHLVPMTQQASQPSPLGTEWQYLSRRFDRPLAPKIFLTHIITVIEEL